MTYNPNIHHRNSIRLQSYDYRSAGAYFLTICTFQKETILAEIAEVEARLTPMGEIVREEWLKSAGIRQEIKLDEYVVMPNHFHGIVFIHDLVGAHGMRPDIMRPEDIGPDCIDTENRAHGRAPLHRPSKSLGSFVAGFKSACTKRINELRDTPGLQLWQRNYHERVIRNEDDLLALRTYIQNNPARWEEDPEREEMDTSTTIAENNREPFRRLVEIIEQSGVPFRIHEHQATRTMEDAAQNLSFDVERIVKTVAFRTRSSLIVLAAVRGTRRVDYARLAALVTVNRRDLAALSPDEVMEHLGVEPGSVSPLPLLEDAVVLIDEDVLTILPTLYCGIGRSDRTLELAACDLVRLTSGRVGGFSREGK